MSLSLLLPYRRAVQFARLCDKSREALANERWYAPARSTLSRAKRERQRERVCTGMIPSARK